MKAPDKLYLGRRSYGPLIGGWQTNPFESKEIESIAYIRKDTLLKKVMETVERREPHQIDAYNNDDYEAGFIDGADRMRKIVTTIINSL